MTDRATLTFEGHEIDVQVLRLQKDDRIVLSTRHNITMEIGKRIKDAAKEAFPDNKIVLLNDVELAVVRDGAAREMDE